MKAGQPSTPVRDFDPPRRRLLRRAPRRSKGTPAKPGTPGSILIPFKRGTLPLAVRPRRVEGPILRRNLLESRHALAAARLLLRLRLRAQGEPAAATAHRAPVDLIRFQRPAQPALRAAGDGKRSQRRALPQARLLRSGSGRGVELRRGRGALEPARPRHLVLAGARRFAVGPRHQRRLAASRPTADGGRRDQQLGQLARRRRRRLRRAGGGRARRHPPRKHHARRPGVRVRGRPQRPRSRRASRCWMRRRATDSSASRSPPSTSTATVTRGFWPWVRRPSPGVTARCTCTTAGRGGLSRQPGQTLQTEAARNFGWSIDGAGDFDGDGFGDLVIGAPTTGSGALISGMAFVISGASTGMGLITRAQPRDGKPAADRIHGGRRRRPRRRQPLRRGGWCSRRTARWARLGDARQHRPQPDAAGSEPIAQRQVRLQRGVPRRRRRGRHLRPGGGCASGWPGPRAPLLPARIGAAPLHTMQLDGSDGTTAQFGGRLASGDADGDGICDLGVSIPLPGAGRLRRRGPRLHRLALLRHRPYRRRFRHRPHFRRSSTATAKPTWPWARRTSATVWAASTGTGGRRRHRAASTAATPTACFGYSCRFDRLVSQAKCVTIDAWRPGHRIA